MKVPFFFCGEEKLLRELGRLKLGLRFESWDVLARGFGLYR